MGFVWRILRAWPLVLMTCANPECEYPANPDPEISANGFLREMRGPLQRRRVGDGRQEETHGFLHIAWYGRRLGAAVEAEEGEVGRLGQRTAEVPAPGVRILGCHRPDVLPRLLLREVHGSAPGR